MQIYTQILLGMAVGAVVGLTLGPSSRLLTADVFAVEDARTVELRLDPADPKSALPVPPGVKLRLKLVDPDSAAAAAEPSGPDASDAWVAVQFEYSDRLSLRDERGALSDRLGRPRTGALVTAHLRLTLTRLESGEIQRSMAPVSALGLTVIEVMRPIGALFMRLIKMVIVPLVFASLLVGVASLGDVRKLGRLGGRALLLYMATTAAAVTIGLLMAHLIEPGRFVDPADRQALVAQFGGAADAKSSAAGEAPSTIENLLAIVPENPIGALASGDMLPIIFFALVFGVALTLLGEGESKPVVVFFDKVQAAMIVVIHLVMALAPFGVAALVAEVVGTSGLSVLSALLVYGVAVILGLLVHTLIIYGGLVKLLARLPLIGFMRSIRSAQLIAFSTSSSAAALPVSLEVAEENLGISKGVASFVLPLGSTVNMDGTALYQGVAALFIAQVFQMDLTLADELSIVLAATLASIGAAGVPGAGMITLAMVLTAAGIPPVGLALILGMDRILDMFRTTVNVTGDLAVAAVMARAEGERLGLNPRALDSAASQTSEAASRSVGPTQPRLGGAAEGSAQGDGGPSRPSPRPGDDSPE